MNQDLIAHFSNVHKLAVEEEISKKRRKSLLAVSTQDGRGLNILMSDRNIPHCTQTPPRIRDFLQEEIEAVD